MTDTLTPQPLLLENLTSPKAGEMLQQIEMVIIPVGALEQHGPALPLSTDTLTATVMAQMTGALLAPKVAIAPTIPWGVSWHHFGRPGTISLKPETLISIVIDQVDSLYRQGVKRFVLMNTHGGNNAALAMAAERAKRDLGVPLAVSLFGYTLLANAAREVMGPESIGHAGGDEAAAVLAIRPDLVTTSRLENAVMQPDLLRIQTIVTAAGGSLPVAMHKRSASGATGDASKANAEQGSEIIGQAVSALTAICQELLELDLALL